MWSSNKNPNYGGSARRRVHLHFYLVLIVLAQLVINSNSFSSKPYTLKFSDFPDYSFDVNNSCQNVNINLNSPKIVGLIHSPNYGIDGLEFETALAKKCRWILFVPEKSTLELKLIDYGSSNQATMCSSARLNQKLTITALPGSVSKSSSLMMSIPWSKDNSSLSSDQITNCLGSGNPLRPFTRIDVNSNRVVIEFETVDGEFEFLLAFESRPVDPFDCSKSRDHIQCNVKYESTNQYSCVRRELICNCAALNSTKDPNFSNLYDYCDLLIEGYDSFIGAMNKSNEVMCEYLSMLNTRCRADRAPLAAKYQESLVDISLVEDEANEIDFGPLIDEDLHLDIGSNQESANIDLSKLTDPGDLCSNVIRTNEFGWIASPNLYDLNSKSQNEFGLNCSYLIILQQYQNVQLRFKSFYLNGISARTDVSSTNSTMIFYDYDYISIYDGSSINAPLIAHLTSAYNDFNKYLAAKTFNSKTNSIFIVFHTRNKPINRSIASLSSSNIHGFNMTYQIKGLCIDDQLPCKSIFELNCYSRSQRCNDQWDCQNGADERGCGPCSGDQFKCRNNIFCYRAEDRCDGENQCIDKSDELNCDKYTCNSDNGTFLCSDSSGRCIYEQWVCDGTNDCEDGSDELNCPTALTSRRVITTAVLGGTLCCLLLVMALGCACKLYTLHTVGYRNSVRLSQSVAASGIGPVVSGRTSGSNRRRLNRSSRQNQSDRGLSGLSAFIQRRFGGRRESSSSTSSSTTGNNDGAVSLLTHSQSAPSHLQQISAVLNSNQTSSANQSSSDLPMPHHLIAPPTYNQTMGLVDEYEQRQLAFIEHVRTILSQQQQQNGHPGSGSTLPGLINFATTNTNPVFPVAANASSTTVHRVTSGGGSSRRSHSSRHHRHHHHSHHNSGRTSDTGLESGSSGHRIRSHRHHHRHHYSSRRPTAEPNINHMNQFDANRRGLQPEERPVAPSSSSSSTAVDPVQDQINKSTSQQSSANLRDRIAKLIKDIVVHHGDNIQYMQLDPTSQSAASSTVGGNPTSEPQMVTQLSTSSSQSGSAGNEEDDLPLIRRDSTK